MQRRLFFMTAVLWQHHCMLPIATCFLCYLPHRISIGTAEKQSHNFYLNFSNVANSILTFFLSFFVPFSFLHQSSVISFVFSPVLFLSSFLSFFGFHSSVLRYIPFFLFRSLIPYTPLPFPLFFLSTLHSSLQPLLVSFPSSRSAGVRLESRPSVVS